MIHDGIKERAAKRHSYSATQLVMRALCYTMGSAATTRSEGCIRLNYFKSNSLKDIPTSMVSCTCVACHLCDVANVFCWTSLALLGRTGDHSVCLSLSLGLSLTDQWILHNSFLETVEQTTTQKVVFVDVTELQSKQKSVLTAVKTKNIPRLQISTVS